MKKTGKVVGVSLGIVLALAGGIFFLVQQPLRAEGLSAEKPSAQARNAGVAVSVAQPVPKRLAKKFTAMASVRPASEVTVLAETSGRILQLPAQEGMAVTEGSVLAVLDQEARTAVHDAAAAALKKAQQDLVRVQGLYQDSLVSQADLEQAQLAVANGRTQEVSSRKELEAATVRSPIAGKLAEVSVVKGGQLSPGTPVALVVDPSVLKAKVLLPEATALGLKAGDPVAVEAPVFQGRTYSARVSKVGIRGDATNSFPVELVLDEACRRDFQIGMSIQVSFSQVAAQQGLMIPRAAVLGSTRDAEVFVAAGGKAVRTRIQTGAEDGAEIEVLSGLGPQDAVIVVGQNLLADGQTVRITQ